MAPDAIANASRANRQAELILGADFVRSHRLLFAMSQRRLYYSYIGGPVFAPAP